MKPEDASAFIFVLTNDSDQEADVTILKGDTSSDKLKIRYDLQELTYEQFISGDKRYRNTEDKGLQIRK